MNSHSEWKDVKTFFPVFLKHIEKSPDFFKRICVIGAADGKFVIPLAKRGILIDAIEVDKVAVYGGFVEFPDTGWRKLNGLLWHLEHKSLLSQVNVILEDFLKWQPVNHYQAVFTSCSWHYSRNHNIPVSLFIKKMQSLLSIGGLFCAEYMLPITKEHTSIEHYVKPEQLITNFHAGWTILEEIVTDLFIEKAHINNLKDHQHQMGFILAKKK